MRGGARAARATKPSAQGAGDREAEPRRAAAGRADPPEPAAPRGVGGPSCRPPGSGVGAAAEREAAGLLLLLSRLGPGLA